MIKTLHKYQAIISDNKYVHYLLSSEITVTPNSSSSITAVDALGVVASIFIYRACLL